nr:glycosyltransferase family 2 protein [uncultured Blautia sp.]
MSDLISVIIPVYNRENTLVQAINSVLKQTYSNIEVIVVDDCSSDCSVQKIKSITDKRVRLVQHEKNKGACAARNTGIYNAKGIYIAFNDSDDLWRPEKLEKQIEALKKSNADVVFCQMERHNYSTNATFFPILNEGIVDYEKLIIRSKCSTQTMFGKKEVFTEYLFDESIPRMQDYDFVIRSAKEKKYYFINECLVDVYLQTNSITTKDQRKLYEICSLLYQRHADVCKEYPGFEKFLLDSIGYFQVKLGKSAFPTYRRLYRLEPNIKNGGKMILSKLGILKILWSKK